MADQWQQAGAFKCEKTSLRLPLAALLADVERGGRPLGVALCAARAGGSPHAQGIIPIPLIKVPIQNDRKLDEFDRKSGETHN